MPNTLPSSAQALLIALNTPAPNGTIGIPTLLWGRPGVGKSSFIEGLSSDKTKVLTLIASIHDPTDFSGLPLQKDGKVHYAPPAWIDSFADHPEGILFLDELSTCPPAVQAALLRVVFERKVGFTPLPEQVRIVAAANPPDLMVGGWELSPPMRNRFVHLQWELGSTQFAEAMLHGWQKADSLAIDSATHARVLPGWKARIAAFIRIAPELYNGDPGQEKFGYASPRSWEYAAHLMASCEVLGVSPSHELLQGCLGQGTATALLEYLEKMSLPDPREVLANEVAMNPKKLNDGELYVLFSGMERVLNEQPDGKELVEFGDRFLQLTEEISQLGRRDVIFVSLRNLSQAGLLTRLIVQASLHDPLGTQRITQRITQLFEDNELTHFIDVLQ